jgi:hypothetical protein
MHTQQHFVVMPQSAFIIVFHAATLSLASRTCNDDNEQHFELLVSASRAVPGFQGVQAANSSWLNSSRVRKQSLHASTTAQQPLCQHTPLDKNLSGLHPQAPGAASLSMQLHNFRHALIQESIDYPLRMRRSVQSQFYTCM